MTPDPSRAALTARDDDRTLLSSLGAALLGVLIPVLVAFALVTVCAVVYVVAFFAALGWKAGMTW